MSDILQVAWTVDSELTLTKIIGLSLFEDTLIFSGYMRMYCFVHFLFMGGRFNMIH